MLARVGALRGAKAAPHQHFLETSEPRGASAVGGSSAAGLVEKLQSELNKLKANPNLDLDGIFGPATRAALMAFQAEHGLSDDWIPGAKTCALLSALAFSAH